MNHQRIILRIIAVAVISVLVFVVISLFSMSVAMASHGHMMEECPFAIDMENFCGVTATKYLVLWQETSRAIMADTVFVVAIAFFIALYSDGWYVLWRAREQLQTLFFHIRRLVSPDLARLVPMRELLSSGVLHP